MAHLCIYIPTKALGLIMEHWLDTEEDNQKRGEIHSNYSIFSMLRETPTRRL